MKIKNLKKCIAMLMPLVILTSSFTYALNNPFEGEVDAPSAEVKNNISESTIIKKTKIKEITPLNPTVSYIDEEEYNSVNNFNIDLKTLNTRIKYFSPTYKNIKASGESSLWMQYYLYGGSNTLLFDKKSFDDIKDYKVLVDDAKNGINDTEKSINELDKTDPNYAIKLGLLKADLATYTYDYILNSAYYQGSISAVSTVMAGLGLREMREEIIDVDDNSSISSARDQITQKFTSAILSYLKLEGYFEILEKKKSLYKKKYDLALKNYALGISTSVDVSTALSEYEDAKNSYETTKTTFINLKQSICTNLGYSLSDIDKLNFIEPDVDLTAIQSINIDNDRDRAYNSNSAYNNITRTDKDRKLPGSTGDELFYKRQKQTSEQIVVELENLYQKLQAALLTYKGNYYLDQICDLTDKANRRKLETNLVSEMEYEGLDLVNLSNKLAAKTAKYELIEAYNNYHYGVLGNISIS